MDIRNIAIIAHVDHGKTTLVDGLLKQSNTFRPNEAAMQQTLILDSNEQERERGITILAKNTAITYKGVKINIIDTPGHADFSGEVERTLHMADGALLVVDAQEGPMPQTKFVLKRALDLGLVPIVVINKIDQKGARIDEVVSETHDLFLDVATDERQLEAPTLYAVGRAGKAWTSVPHDPSAPGDLTPLFDMILDHVPPPKASDGPFRMLVATLDWDDYQGTVAIGRVARGRAVRGAPAVLLHPDGLREETRLERVAVSAGLKRLDVREAETGDIVAISGIAHARIGDTVADATTPEALPTIAISEPTVTMSVGPNTSPFAGRDGQYVTNRQLLDRVGKELETNVSLRLAEGTENDRMLSGRGELHLSVFLETLRREGYELQVGKPRVITTTRNGVLMEPCEEAIVDVPKEYTGAVMGELGRRRGILLRQDDRPDGTSRLVFEIPTRGLLGFRTALLTLSRGAGLLSSHVLRFDPMGPGLPKLRNGVLIASENGTAVAYGLNIAQGRGTTFIAPQTEVYTGMIIGLNSRQEDIEINVTKEKRLSNMRASGSDEALQCTPPVIMSLERCLDFLADDELLEITPHHLRLRKKLLSATERAHERRVRGAEPVSPTG